jgi:Acetamidase/Formamidase family
MQRILREQARKYAFDWEDEPLLRVKPGESFEIETYDASTGYFKSEADKAMPGKRPGFDRIPPLANPIGGPVYLEGAKKGDVLVVTIEDILVDSYCGNRHLPPHGLAHHRIRLYADRRLLPGQHLPGFSDQCLSNVQDRQVELRGGCGDTEEVSIYEVNDVADTLTQDHSFEQTTQWLPSISWACRKSLIDFLTFRDDKGSWNMTDARVIRVGTTV